jgi:hypothetical protein
MLWLSLFIVILVVAALIYYETVYKKSGARGSDGAANSLAAVNGQNLVSASLEEIGAHLDNQNAYYPDINGSAEAKHRHRFW